MNNYEFSYSVKGYFTTEVKVDTFSAAKDIADRRENEADFKEVQDTVGRLYDHFFYMHEMMKTFVFVYKVAGVYTANVEAEDEKTARAVADWKVNEADCGELTDIEYSLISEEEEKEEEK